MSTPRRPHKPNYNPENITIPELGTAESRDTSGMKTLVKLSPTIQKSIEDSKKTRVIER